MRLGFAFGIVLASVALTAATLPSKPAQIGEDGLISGQGVVLLEPPTWLGKRLPLLPYIEAPEDLGAGTWVLILIHPDCPKCQALLPKYEEIARDWQERGLASRIAVVVVPVRRSARNFYPIGQRKAFCTLGHLSDDREWFVETPTLIKMVEGMVVEATTL
jgi:thiol-disulfide isomerase/thioredoxin